MELALAVLPSAISFTLLGAIESLLSAVVADGMTGRRHRSNCELVAQGAANIASAFFGGFCVTGNIARTATNVRSGAHGPVAGMLHAVFLLLFMLVAAPLAAYIPLAALAGVLTVVAWNMVEKQAFMILLRSGWGDATVVGTTFILTIFRDLTEAIVVGFAIGSILFIHRMSQTAAVEAETPFVRQDAADRDLAYDGTRAALHPIDLPTLLRCGPGRAADSLRSAPPGRVPRAVVKRRERSSRGSLRIWIRELRASSTIPRPEETLASRVRSCSGGRRISWRSSHRRSALTMDQLDKLYFHSLGLTPPWTVAGVRVLDDKSAVEVGVRARGSGPLNCPVCAAPSPRHDTETRKWRHLDTCQLQTIVVAEIPRVKCAAHGVQAVAGPWDAPGSEFQGP